MINRTYIASELYRTYCAAVGGLAFNGDPLPDWEKFATDTAKEKQVNAWLEAADRAIALLGSLHSDQHQALPSRFKIGDSVKVLGVYPATVEAVRFTEENVTLLEVEAAKAGIMERAAILRENDESIHPESKPADEQPTDDGTPCCISFSPRNLHVSRKVIGGEVTLRMVSDDGAQADNLTASEVTEVVYALRGAGLRIFERNALEEARHE